MPSTWPRNLFDPASSQEEIREEDNPPTELVCAVINLLIGYIRQQLTHFLHQQPSLF
jgi:hypothetical protein